jgi:hypothetical protein
LHTFLTAQALNVLLCSNAVDRRGFSAKLSDFGLSFKMDVQETHVSSLYQVSTGMR